jgi:hypothetical protein
MTLRVGCRSQAGSTQSDVAAGQDLPHFAHGLRSSASLEPQVSAKLETSSVSVPYGEQRQTRLCGHDGRAEDGVEFKVEIDDELIGSLDDTITKQLRADPQRRRQLAAFALREALGWMSGSTAYQSLTQQHTEWLTELLPVFFPDKPPSATQIFNSFSVPYGRAAYISRVLLEKQHTVWRARGRSSLLAVLTAKNAEAKKNVARGDGLKHVPIYIDSLAAREFTVLLEELYERDPQLMPPRFSSPSPGRHIVELPSLHFEPLITRLK